jgi:acetyl-CoA synthetase
LRGDKLIPLKANSDKALAACPQVRRVIVVRRSGQAVDWHAARDVWYHEAVAAASTECPVEVMASSDPLFILYTSGSTGKPKGVLHTTGGYMVYAAATHHAVFDCRPDDVFWCTADVGWITGHTYVVYGPLANGTTTLMFEGVPHYPDFSRYWKIVDEHQVSVFYTSPTAVRALRREGDEWVTKTRRDSLRLLGSVGEPMNAEVWHWYYAVVGNARCPIVDTWWQTETGGIMLTALPGATPLKPGAVAWPFFGVVADIVDEHGQSVPTGVQGSLVIRHPWPGLMQTIYGDPQRFIDTYFKPFPGCYFTGDGAYCDASGYYTITGRTDDVINVSGHRLGTGEIESVLLLHPAVSEAGVVGVAHEVTGEAIYAFVTTKVTVSPSEALKQQLIDHVRQHIGVFVKIETIQWADRLPKTRSGKIMRRILRKIANNATGRFAEGELGDLSTLADPDVVDSLVAGR